MGAAGTHYARSVEPKTVLPAALPEPEVLFDSLLARKIFTPHPNKISSVLFYLASIIIHGRREISQEALLLKRLILIQTCSEPIGPIVLSRSHRRTSISPLCMGATRRNKMPFAPSKTESSKPTASLTLGFLDSRLALEFF